MRARVYVMLKPSVLDPQGKAVQHALASLGYTEVADVRQGKIFELKLNEHDRSRAKRRLQDMAKKLLANTIIEEFRVEIVEE